jgi:hypothetical protein
MDKILFYGVKNKASTNLKKVNLHLHILKTESDTPTKKIKSLYELYQLSQLIKEATRVTMITSSLIDHIVTNTPQENLRFWCRS